MTANLIIHSSHHINCSKFINHFTKVGGNHFKYYNNVLVPYFCKEVNHNNRIIVGKFIWPVWHTLERTILSRGAHFNCTYIIGKDFTIEHKPSEFKNYHIFGSSNIFANKIQAFEGTLHPNSILLFSIPSEVAKPLIDRQLLQDLKKEKLKSGYTNIYIKYFCSLSALRKTREFFKPIKFDPPEKG